MNSILFERHKPIYFEFDHFALITEAVSTITAGPVKGVFTYFAPVIGAWIFSQEEIRPDDPLQGRKLTEIQRNNAIKLVKDLKGNMYRNLLVYKSDSYTCSSFGGFFSIGSPIISIPQEFIKTLSEDPPAVNDSIFEFTRDEIQFFVAREIASIRSHNQLIRFATKVSLVAVLFFINALALPVMAGAVCVGASVAFNVFLERRMKNQLDIEAVSLLKSYYTNDIRVIGGGESAITLANQAGVSAIKKLIKQNVDRLDRNGLCEVYITKHGNNLLDLTNPFLTVRLNRLNEHIGAGEGQPIPQPQVEGLVV